MKQNNHRVRAAARVGGIVLFAFALSILAFNLTIFIQSYTRPNQVPNIFGVAPLIVQSGSMEPVIKHYDLILCKKTNTATLAEGDIITYQPEDSNTVVTHRIVGIEDNGENRQFITKGDYNNDEDLEPVAESQVVGRYFARIPRMGRLVSFLLNPYGMTICAVVPLVLFLIFDMLRRRAYDKANPRPENENKEELEYLRALAANWTQESAPPPAQEEDGPSAAGEE